MVKPLRSEDPTPQNMQFAHFGVLNDGNQSKTSLFTSITLNIVIALVRRHHQRSRQAHHRQEHKLTSDRASSHQEG